MDQVSVRSFTHSGSLPMGGEMPPSFTRGIFTIPLDMDGHNP